MLRRLPATGAHTSTTDHPVSTLESQVPALESKDRCRAILKNQGTRRSLPHRLCGCQYPLVRCCSSHRDKTPSWVSSSTLRVVRRARYKPSAGDRSFRSCRHAALSSPPALQIAVIVPYGFGDVRVATLALFTFTTPLDWPGVWLLPNSQATLSPSEVRQQSSRTLRCPGPPPPASGLASCQELYRAPQHFWVCIAWRVPPTPGTSRCWRSKKRFDCSECTPEATEVGPYLTDVTRGGPLPKSSSCACRYAAT